jgi:hypothetical protein
VAGVVLPLFCKNGLVFASVVGANLMVSLDGSNAPGGVGFKNGFAAAVGVLLGWNGDAAGLTPKPPKPVVLPKGC